MKVAANSTQLTSLVNTYPGQIIYPTTTGGIFTIDEYRLRNSANTSWWKLENTEESQVSSKAIAGTTTIGGGVTPYYNITLPTTYNFYLITGIEWKNGATVAGDVTCGVDLLDANPPVTDQTQLLGVVTVAQSGANSIQRTNLIVSEPIRGGSNIGVWFNRSNGTATFSFLAAPDINNNWRAISYTTSPATSSSNAFQDTNDYYIKVYYRGYLTS